MFFLPTTDEWGDTVYNPTVAGSTLIVLLICGFLLLSFFFAGKRLKKLSPRQLAFCAVCVGLGTVLSAIRVFHFPTGGSITLLSMLVIILPGYWYGITTGILSGIAYGLLQMLIDPYILFPAQVLVDYILAFAALGLSGLWAFKNKGIIPAYITGVVGRYVFAVLSGWIFFGIYAWEGWAALPYSLVYNAIYIFAEFGITIIILNVPPVKKAMEKVKIMARHTHGHGIQ